MWQQGHMPLYLGGDIATPIVMSLKKLSTFILCSLLNVQQAEQKHEVINLRQSDVAKYYLF